MMKKQQGMTLLEVMVALFITVVGTLGAVALQASAKKGSFDSMQRSLATNLAEDIIERMRNNDRDTLDAYEGTYGVTPMSVPALRCTAPLVTSPITLCDPAEMVADDLYTWEQSLIGADALSGSKNVGGLIGGVACIEHNDNMVTVMISWQGRVELSDGASSSYIDPDDTSKGSAVNCGSTLEDKKRREVRIDAFIY